MKVHLKKYTQHWLRLTDPQDPMYHPGKAANYYKAHQEEIEWMLEWWRRNQDEWFKRFSKRLHYRLTSEGK